jgi:hypothetical protein
MQTPKKLTKTQIRAVQRLFSSHLQSGKIRLAAYRVLKALETEDKTSANSKKSK